MGNTGRSRQAFVSASSIAYPNVETAHGIHYSNESCSISNWLDLWETCKNRDPPLRLFISRASYHTSIGGGRGQWLGGIMASAEHEPITGVWRQSPQRGPGGEPLVRGSGGEASLTP